MSLFPSESEYQKRQRSKNLSDGRYKIQRIPRRNISIEIKKMPREHNKLLNKWSIITSSYILRTLENWRQKVLKLISSLPEDRVVLFSILNFRPDWLFNQLNALLCKAEFRFKVTFEFKIKLELKDSLVQKECHRNISKFLNFLI